MAIKRWYDQRQRWAGWGGNWGCNIILVESLQREIKFAKAPPLIPSFSFLLHLVNIFIFYSFFRTNCICICMFKILKANEIVNGPFFDPLLGLWLEACWPLHNITWRKTVLKSFTPKKIRTCEIFNIYYVWAISFFLL